MLTLDVERGYNSMPSPSTYHSDFYAWTKEQTEILRNQQWHKLDLENLIEEIESLGRQQRQELRNRLAILLGHLLKWQHQSEQRRRSWLATIRVQRRDILKLIKENPSLKTYLSEAISDGYDNGRDLAMGETNLPEETFLQQYSYIPDQILSLDFYPDN
ncbi:DUF29 family protein [Synechocystis sp. CACIAM 05]|uniref:DUF29 family protein n=1 Tax=Synechocystis sp. CACIAM 05 TaxID=1933929 RepID=UPI001391B616